MHDTVRSPARQNIRLLLASQPDDIPLARELLRGVAEAAGIGVQQMDDIRTAVSEACNNAVQHAYDGAIGPIELDVALQSDVLVVSVRDHGKGLDRQACPGGPDTPGIGLMVIKALCEHAELTAGPGSGLEVRMRFRVPGLSALDPGGEVPPLVERFDPASLSISLAIGPASLARCVLPRLLTATATRAHFSTDRMSDLELVGDAIVADCQPLLEGSHLCVRVSASARMIMQTIWPLEPGGAARLLAGSCGAIERLSDEWEILREDSQERLIISVRDRR